MATGVVTVGRKQYVSGLYWENSPTGSISQAAKEAARQPGTHADFFATRSGNKQGRVPQFGLAQSAEGVKAGMPSLAACMANQQPGSWIGAFRLREGVGLIIVRDDLIVPDGDQFFIDEVEARDRLYQEMGIGGFQKIYAPEAWGVPGADSMPITLLLNERADVRLHMVALSQQAKIGIIGGFVLLLSVLGVGWYIQDQAEREEAERQAKLAELRRIQEQAANFVGIDARPEYPKPDRTWEKQPRPLDYLKACEESLQKVSLAVAGWSLKGIRCSASSLDIQWGRTGGFSAPPPAAIVNDVGDRADRSIPLQGLGPRGPEELVDPDVITKRYLAQNWTASLRREPDDPPPPPPAGYKGEWKPPPPPWVKRSFTFTVPVLPWTLPSFLGDIPGVWIKSAALSGNGVEVRASWKVEGVIYENRR